MTKYSSEADSLHDKNIYNVLKYLFISLGQRRNKN